MMRKLKQNPVLRPTFSQKQLATISLQNNQFSQAKKAMESSSASKLPKDGQNKGIAKGKRGETRK